MAIGVGWLARLARGDGSDGSGGVVRCGAVRAWVRGEAREGRSLGWLLGRGGEAGWDGRVAAGSITETAGRAAERATKGDENFPAAAKVLSARRPREKSAENARPRRTRVGIRRRGASGVAASSQRYAFFIGASIAGRERI